MKRFRFPLQPVAVLRAHREARAREAFSAAKHAYLLTDQALAATRRRVAEFEAELAAGRSGRFSAAAEAGSLVVHRRECAAEAEAERAVVLARAEMQTRRADYLEAHLKLEVVKRLEEKARGSHRLTLNREEQAEFDDFAGRRGRRTTRLT